METNKLIAEFMGCTYNEDWEQPWEDENGCLHDELKYHSSWDWLMPVVEYIEQLGGYTFYIVGTSCYINGSPPSVHGESKIEAVYKKVVQFINWYNKENEKPQENLADKVVYPVNHSDAHHIIIKCKDGHKYGLGAVKAGEKRCPKKGEWYLSGAITCAYLAFNDLSQEHVIARLVYTTGCPNNHKPIKAVKYIEM